MRILAWPAYANAKHNPYNALLYGGMEGAEVHEYSHKKAILRRFDILHIHWPDGFINQPGWLTTFRRMAILFTVVTVAKLRGTKIVWTVHNLLPHDAYHPKLASRFLEWFALRADGLIFLGNSSMQVYRDKYGIAPKQVAAVIPHGHYRGVYKAMPSKESARAELNLPEDKKILLFLGLIKPYKNVDRLIADFIALNDPDTILVVAGSAGEGIAQPLNDMSRGRDNVRLFLQFVPDDWLGVFYAAADIVVLPFKNILNSGSALLSLSFNRKIVAPALGTMVELRDAVGQGWMHLYSGDFNQNVLKDAIVSGGIDGGVCDLDAFEWNRLGAQTLDLYRAVRAGA